MPQPVNTNRVNTVQAAADKEAAVFLKSFDTNQTPGLQPDEITDDFALKLLNKSYSVQKAIVKRLPKDSLYYLNTLLSMIAAGVITDPTRFTRDIVKKAGALIKLRHENSSRGQYRFSYIPLKPGPNLNPVRVYC
ncbi:MAG: hypothetical protein WCW67_07820 [Candidatus Margulisiibacteriota bacterium]|jgi:hypothetical protein